MLLRWRSLITDCDIGSMSLWYDVVTMMSLISLCHWCELGLTNSIVLKWRRNRCLQPVSKKHGQVFLFLISQPISTQVKPQTAWKYFILAILTILANENAVQIGWCEVMYNTNLKKPKSLYPSIAQFMKSLLYPYKYSLRSNQIYTRGKTSEHVFFNEKHVSWIMMSQNAKITLCKLSNFGFENQEKLRMR